MKLHLQGIEYFSLLNWKAHDVMIIAFYQDDYFPQKNKQILNN